jgi:phage gp16-like protein
MSVAARASLDRRGMLAKIHIEAKDRGLDEATRRDLVERVTGHRSCGDCSDGQLVAVLDELKRLGGHGRRPARPKPATTPIALKARALWKSLHNLGVVKNGAEPALEAFAKRQLRVDRLQWADQSQGYRLIEALKQMAERAGWSQDVAGVRKGQDVISLKRRLVQRQAEILGVAPFRLHDMTERELEQLAIENGKKIRAGAAA